MFEHFFNLNIRQAECQLKLKGGMYIETNEPNRNKKLNEEAIILTLACIFICKYQQKNNKRLKKIFIIVDRVNTMAPKDMYQ